MTIWAKVVRFNTNFSLNFYTYTMHGKITKSVFSLFLILISTHAFSQITDFKLVKAIKTSELMVDRGLDDELLEEIDILPEDKRYLIITSEVTYEGEQKLRLQQNMVGVGENGNTAVGYLRLGNRGSLRWSFHNDLWQGKNHFTSIFIVDAKLSKTVIDINGQRFDIPKIVQGSQALDCLPKTTVTEKKFIKGITFEDSYRKANNQPYTKKISPKSGTLLELSLALEFCENPELFTKKSFTFEPTFFQVQGSDGTLYNCVGTFSFGKFRNPSTYNILGKDSLTQEVKFIFNVPKEGQYTLKYLGNEVSKI